MNFKKAQAIMLCGALTLSCLAGCNTQSPPSSDHSASTSAQSTQPSQQEAETAIILSDSSVTVNGQAAGTEQGDVYLSHDIIYYEDRDSYESGNPYGEGEQADRHTADEAAAHTVVNITAPGRYRLSGQLSKGQIRVDLGEDSFEDPEAVVTLILDNADISCEVAPAILFLNVYECDNAWSVDTASSAVDTTAAGANLILAEDSVNNISGSYVARIYKDTDEEKKLWKQDGAVYSYMSMNVDGPGTMNLNAENEGLDSELHLTINGGSINIFAGNDGINTNEDGVSVTTINAGNLHIVAGLGEEGDGIDSNGWLVINGGTVVSGANPAADAGLDSDMGSYINGGTVIALGSAMDWAESDSDQITMNLQFAAQQDSGSAIVVTDEDGRFLFAYDPSEDEVLGEHKRSYSGAILSSPNLTLNDTCHVFLGGTLTGTETAGIYEVSSITAYEDGVQQAYTGSDLRMGPGGMGGGHPAPEGGQPPEGFDGTKPQRPEQGEMPEGFEGQFPEGMTPPDGFEGQLPEGMTPPDGFEGQLPEGMTPPEGFDPSAVQSDPDTQSQPKSGFYLQDKVNCFSGIADYTE